MYGSTETNAFRTRISPVAGVGKLDLGELEVGAARRAPGAAPRGGSRAESAARARIRTPHPAATPAVLRPCRGPIRNLSRPLLPCRAARRRVGTGERLRTPEEDARRRRRRELDAPYLDDPRPLSPRLGRSRSLHAPGAAAGDFADEPCSRRPATATSARPQRPASLLRGRSRSRSRADAARRSASARACFRRAFRLLRRGRRARHADTGRELHFYITVSYTCGACGKAPISPTSSSPSTSTRPAPPRLIVTTASLPDANINQAVHGPGADRVGCDTVTSWTLAGGTLPAGPDARSERRHLRARRRRAATFAFTVQANGERRTATRSRSRSSCSRRSSSRRSPARRRRRPA